MPISDVTIVTEEHLLEALIDRLQNMDSTLATALREVLEVKKVIPENIASYPLQLGP